MNLIRLFFLYTIFHISLFIRTYYLDSTSGFDNNNTYCNISYPCQTFEYIHTLITIYNPIVVDDDDLKIILLTNEKVYKLYKKFCVVLENGKEFYVESYHQHLVNPIIVFEFDEGGDDDEDIICGFGIRNVQNHGESSVKGISFMSKTKEELIQVRNLIEFSKISDVNVYNISYGYDGNFDKFIFKGCRVVENVKMWNISYDFEDNSQFIWNPVYFFDNAIVSVKNFSYRDSNVYSLFCKNCGDLTIEDSEFYNLLDFSFSKMFYSLNVYDTKFIQIRNTDRSERLFHDNDIKYTLFNFTNCVFNLNTVDTIHLRDVYHVGVEFRNCYFFQSGRIYIKGEFNANFYDCVFTDFYNSNLLFLPDDSESEEGSTVVFQNTTVRNFVLPSKVNTNYTYLNYQLELVSTIENIDEHSYALHCKNNIDNYQNFNNGDEGKGYVIVSIDKNTVFENNLCDPDLSPDQNLLYGEIQSKEYFSKKYNPNFICVRNQKYFLFEQPLLQENVKQGCVFKGDNHKRFCYFNTISLDPQLVTTVIIQLIFWPSSFIVMNVLFCTGLYIFCIKIYRPVNKKEKGDVNNSKEVVEIELIEKKKEENIKKEKKDEKKRLKCKFLQSKGFQFIKILLYYIFLEVRDSWAMWLSLSEFLYRPSTSVYFLQSSDPKQCDSIFPNDYDICSKRRVWNVFNELYYYCFILSMIVLLLFVLCEGMFLFLWVGVKNMFNLLKFCIYFLSFREWIVYRVFISCCYLFVAIAGVFFSANKFWYKISVGNSIEYTDYVNCILLEVALFYKIFRILNYDGLSSWEYVRKLKELEKENRIDEEFPQVKEPFYFIFLTPHKIFENMCFTLLLSENRKDVDKLKRSSYYSHFLWSFIEKCDDMTIKKLRRFFFNEKLRESKYARVFFTKPFSRRWFKSVFKCDIPYLIRGKIKKNKLFITVRTIIYLFILFIKEIFDLWIVLFIFLKKGENPNPNIQMNSFPNLYSYLFVYCVCIEVYFQVHIILFQIIWINRHIVSTLRMSISYLVFSEWIVYRVIMVSVYIFIMVFGFIFGIYSNSEAEGGDISIKITTGIVVSEILLSFRVIEILHYDGIGSEKYLEKFLSLKKKNILSNFPDINVDIFDMIMHHPKEIIEEVFLTILVTKSTADMKVKKNLACFSHLNWHYTSRLKENDYKQIKDFFFSKEDLNNKSTRYSDFCFKKPTRGQFWKAFYSFCNCSPYEIEYDPPENTVVEIENIQTVLSSTKDDIVISEEQCKTSVVVDDMNVSLSEVEKKNDSDDNEPKKEEIDNKLLILDIKLKDEETKKENILPLSNDFEKERK